MENFNRAMLVNLSISAWSARKYDKKITAETNASHGATDDAGRYNKSLMPGDASSYKALTQFVANLRVVNYAQTLPWSDTGWRLLPIKNYTVYTDLMRKAQHEFNTLLDAFVADYPSLREVARQRLNGMYNEDDYPSNVKRRYSFGIDFAPVPVGTDFRVTLAQTEMDVIAKRTEDRVKQAFADAQGDAVSRLYKVVGAIHERLTTIGECSKCNSTGMTTETRKGYDLGATVQCWICDGKGKVDATFRDSLITNAREICDALTRLNVSDDPELEKFRRQTEVLASTEPETLRNYPDTRTETANQAQSILDAMMATFGPMDGGN